MGENLLLSLLGEMEYSVMSHNIISEIFRGIVIKICSDGGVVCMINDIEEYKDGKLVKKETVKMLKHIPFEYIEEIKFRYNDGTYAQHKLEQYIKKILS